MGDIFTSGVRPAIDAYLLNKSEEVRDYGDYWSASSAGYCKRKLIFDRLKVPHVKEQDARKTRVFEAGHIFHSFLQGITKEAGISIAQEVELQDEDLMVRGHFDDLILAGNNLILYDYKTQNSRAFTYQKGKPMSYYHRLQLGTYMYMLRKNGSTNDTLSVDGGLPIYDNRPYDLGQLTEARILKISKDDLRMSEQQLFWNDELEGDVLAFWNELNQWWRDKKLPPCSCADHEGGFLAREAYNDFWFNGEPCSLEWYQLNKEKGLVH